MINRFKIITYSVVFSFLVIGVVIYFGSSRTKTEWIIMSGNQNGKYHEVAKALGEILSEKEEFKIKIKTSSGSVENLNELLNGNADLALLQNDISSTETVHSITTLYEEALHIIVKNDINSTGQLKGKTISMGKEGGGTESLALATLNLFGMNENDFHLKRESLETSLENLEQGDVDCVFVVTAVGNAIISKYLRKGNFKLLHIGSNPFENLKLSYPFIQPSTIPSEAYHTKNGIRIPSKTIQTIGTKVVLACDPKLSVENAYEIARLTQTKKADLTKAHPLLAQISNPTDYLLQHSIHEGASLYYDRERPNFFQKWADTIALVFSVIAIAWGAAKAMSKIYLQKLKDNLDTFFAKVDEITSELIEGVGLERAKELAKELHQIRRVTTKKLIAEELSADDSFVIFQRQLHTAQQLVNECLRKDAN